MTRFAIEANFDGLVGPTHNYAGLSFGNVASANNANRVSNPREAALQGLAKMKALADLGYAQGVLPPQERPSVAMLRTLGFSGSDGAMIREAARTAPALLGAACSAASMWTANAATVSPSADTADGRVHFTAANLCSKLHRAIEHDTTSRVLRVAFGDASHFAHHDALPGWPSLGDEGAANHTRLCGAYGERGVEFFVYGRDDLSSAPAPRRFPARQTLQASQAIARLHGLAEDDVVFAQQHPDAIDAGVFHNDVIAVGNGNVLFCHAQAFVDQPAVLARLRERLAARGAELEVIEVSSDAVSLEDTVGSYLFNSQLLARPPDAGGGMRLVVPQECRERTAVWRYLESLVADDGPIRELHVFDLRESMRNGGGPACLRLRVVLTEQERRATHAGLWIDDARYAALTDWVKRHYRDRLAVSDLADPALLDECRTALDDLTRLLGLGADLYPFQRNA
ncbi:MULTISPECIES: N-succinylarginine dihydrolase [Pandoraea]|uniref:N-succinylarginine dihydrolase n=1 Tax=Pandoraea pnomenusa TaxID=93220 RepID=A0ABY6WFA1_9BURK|nr:MULTISPECIES: N-succinylarginine dihydrolase [Pandoraea]AHB78137.1 N-succinylarginine dihydrolase [Pandoraea pnomenusa]AHN73567.1 succinylarginine dihydrolase [Pandoraea pnomenusa]ANC46795.1 succinylarginine dihydrolase [Pandoraea pnomenusa]QDH60037.1 N-succinylarginine dihydrolase [Pandoraea pnomenusa]VVE62428.1 N-succinylarginine dihydrolase [Pandoraea pnomenusa]